MRPAATILKVLVALVTVMASAAHASTTAISAADGGSAVAQGGGLALAIEPVGLSEGSLVGLRFIVRNTGETECTLPTIADGSLSITALERDGSPVFPALRPAPHYVDGLGSEIVAASQPVPPGDSVELLMDAGSGDGAALAAVTYAGSGRHLSALWPIAPQGRHELTAVYRVPDLGERVGGMCPGTAVAAIAFEPGARADLLPLAAAVAVGLIVGLLAVVGLLLILRRRGRLPRSGAVAGIVLLLALGPSLSPPPAAGAIVIDPPAPNEAGDPVGWMGVVEGCFLRFAGFGGDPAGVYANARSSARRIEIRARPTGRASTVPQDPLGYTPGEPADSYIFFNDQAAFQHSDGVASDQCAILYHELSHAVDFDQGTDSHDMCGSTGIKLVEVRATLAENAYRIAQGLPPRTSYEGRTLPRSIRDCDRRPGPRGPSRRGVECEDEGCGSSNGDPHLRTFDKRFYDFQAAGEFVLTRSADHTFEVQVRQVPFDGSRYVTINTALAFGVSGDRVGVYVGGVHQGRAVGPLRVTVNGEPDEVDGQVALPSGGTLERGEDPDGGSFLLTWPNGAAAWVSPVGEWGVRLEIDPAEEHRGALEGLLGNHDGHAGNDFVTRDGQPVDAIDTREQLYDVFGDSWRLSPEESLFDYDEGDSTQTFTIPELPVMLLEPSDLPDFELLQGLCESGGVTDEEFQRQCILDLGLTGQWDFGDGAASAQAVVIPVPAEEVATTPPPVPPAPDVDIGQVTGVTRLDGRTIGPDGTLYASVGLADDRYELQAIDPRSGEVLRAIEAQDAGDVHYAAGSVWVEAFDGRREFFAEKGCSITRIDARSFEVQATIPVGCQLYDVQFVAAGDAIWFVDLSERDADGDGWKVTRIDPDTDEPAESVDLPFSDGYLQSSGEALFYSHFDHPFYRLTEGAWVSLGRREGRPVVADQGLWVQDAGVAAFYTSAGAPDMTVPIDGFLVAADASGVYVSRTGAEGSDELRWYPLDRSAPVQIAAAPVPDGNRLHFMSDAPLLQGPDALVQVWHMRPHEGEASLVIQRIARP